MVHQTFASRLNRQVYASWPPDTESTHIDAISILWPGKYIYLIPPFSLLWPVLTKVEEDQVELALIIVPYWPTQSWFPRIMDTLMAEAWISSSRKLYLRRTTDTFSFNKTEAASLSMYRGGQSIPNVCPVKDL